MKQEEAFVFNANDEISIRDSLLYAGANWKKILGIALIIALLLGAYGGVTMGLRALNQEEVIDEIPEDEEEEDSKVPSSESGDFAIIAQPEDCNLKPGETAEFYVATTGKVKKYQWQYSKDGMEWVNLSAMYKTAKTDTLTFKSMKNQDGYAYRCLVTFDDDTMTPSDAAFLYVEENAISKMDHIGTSDIIRAVIKKLILGIILGAFIGTVWQILKFIFKGYISNESSFLYRYGGCALGTVTNDSYKGSMRWALDKLTYRNKTDSDNSIRLIAANLSASIPEGEAVKVIGTVPEETLAEVCEKVQESTGVKITPLGNINESPEAVKALAKGDKVICVEKVFGSQMTNVDFEIMRVKQFAAEYLGFILVE